MKCFILSTMDYQLIFFSPLPIIYCILLFVCQSLNNKLVRRTGQQSSKCIYLQGFKKARGVCENFLNTIFLLVDIHVDTLWK